MTKVDTIALVPPGRISLNVRIPKTGGGYWPHLVDIYWPHTYVACLIGLHGGGGAKESFARATGIVTSPLSQPIGSADVNYSLLSAISCMVVLVQGQACKGVDPAWGKGNNPFNPFDLNTVTDASPTGTTTWDNGFMYSGVDDASMLKDLKAMIIAMEGNGVGISLFGHSNGAFMTAKMWYLASGSGVSFTHYGVASGAAAASFVGHALPALKRPIYFQWGGSDVVIDIKGGPYANSDPNVDHFFDALLTQNVAQLSIVDVTYANTGQLSQLIGPFEQLKVCAAALGQAGQMVGGDGVSKPCTGPYGGTEKVWTYAGGTAVGRLISNGGHPLQSQRACTARQFLGDFARFIAST